MTIVFVDQADPAHASMQASSSREIVRLEELARQLGCRVHPIPAQFDEACSAQDALCWLPRFDESRTALWLGFIPSHERYAALFEAALEHNVRLIHTPAQFEMAMDLEHHYPRIATLTSRSIILGVEEAIEEVRTRTLDYPMFVKGGFKSNKEHGEDACVAHDEAGLIHIIEALRAQPARTQGRIVLRELLALRHLGERDQGMLPLTREYRAFVLNQEILSVGFYWQEHEDEPLSQKERQDVEQLVRRAARQIDVPYVAVDVAQLVDGSWKVIEVGDAQFMGLSQNNAFKVWQGLLRVLNEE